jgi:hypothetical protein
MPLAPPWQTESLILRETFHRIERYSLYRSRFSILNKIPWTER